MRVSTHDLRSRSIHKFNCGNAHIFNIGWVRLGSVVVVLTSSSVHAVHLTYKPFTVAGNIPCK